MQEHEAVQMARGAERYPMIQLESDIRADVRSISLVGPTGIFRACVLADLSARLDRPLVIMSPTSKGARSLSRDLSLFVTNEDWDGIYDEVVT